MPQSTGGSCADNYMTSQVNAKVSNYNVELGLMDEVSRLHFDHMVTKDHVAWKGWCS